MKPFDSNDVSKMAFGLMNDWQKERFIKNREVDMGYEVYGLGRFRVNVFQQRGKIRIALRIVPYQIKGLKDLHLPKVLENISLEHRGLILVTGTTGSGKSTTLASMIDIVNNNRNCHIITIEDPIEFIHEDKKSIEDQREIGSDTNTFSSALRVALRQDPDVILVGEMRDLETAAAVLTIAETGHMVFSTGHAPSAYQAMERVIDMFPPEHRYLAQTRLASLIVGVICQALVPRADGSGRIAAVEVMMGTPAVSNLIREGKIYQLPNVIRTSAQDSMESLDQALVNLYLKGTIGGETLTKFCQDRDEVEKLIGRVPRVLMSSALTGGKTPAHDKR
jgi:twitching motility protein PilT